MCIHSVVARKRFGKIYHPFRSPTTEELFITSPMPLLGNSFQRNLRSHIDPCLIYEFLIA
jgi:hypothetical protein